MGEQGLVLPAPGAIIRPGGARGPPSCAACVETSASAADLRTHWKSERHLYNMVHRGLGFQPLTENAWENTSNAELQIESGSRCKSKRTAPRSAYPQVLAHEAITPSSENDAGGEVGEDGEDGQEDETVEDDEPLSPRQSLFDDQRFETVDDALTYMERVYYFQIPDRDELADLAG